MREMSNTDEENNDVNGTGTVSEGVASGRCPVKQQRRPYATAELQTQKRRVWSKEDNKLLFECYIIREPERRGYMKRLADLWRRYSVRDELKNVREQRLADQVRQIKIKKWLEVLEQEEITKRIRNEMNGTVTVDGTQTVQETHAGG